jgi:hypothetical protein
VLQLGRPPGPPLVDADLDPADPAVAGEGDAAERQAAAGAAQTDCSGPARPPAPVGGPEQRAHQQLFAAQRREQDRLAPEEDPVEERAEETGRQQPHHGVGEQLGQERHAERQPQQEPGRLGDQRGDQARQRPAARRRPTRLRHRAAAYWVTVMVPFIQACCVQW